MATLAKETPQSIPALTAERQANWPRRTRTRLANGLEVVLAESHTIPKFCGELYFRSGNAAVCDRGSALADLTATVVRTGTANRTNRQIEERLRGLGSDLSTSAGQDTSAIGFSGLSEFAQPLLELVSELAREASFPEAEFERERRQKLEEIKLERTQPGFLGSERLRKVLLGSHPYAQVSPSPEQLKTYNRDILRDVYHRIYAPENALLIMVGDFESDKMLKTVEGVFGGWTGKSSDPQPVLTPPPPRTRRVFVVDLPGSVQAQVVVGSHAITRKHPDWIKLGLTNSIYGGAFNSRLVMNIREDKGYTYSPRSGVTPFRQLGFFSVSAAVRNEVVAASLTEIFYEIDKMRAVPVPGSELADAQNYLSGVFSMGLATQEGLLSQFSVVYLNELSEDYLESYRSKVRALTSEDVQLAAQKYLDSPNMQIVVVGDRKLIERQAALFGEVEVYDAQGKRQ